MGKIDNITSKSLFWTLMNILTDTEIHTNAKNRYYVTSETSDIIVKFMVRGNNGLDVYIAATEPIVALNGYRLELNPQDEERLFQKLNSRIHNKAVKKLTSNDFDRISSVLKSLYIGSEIKDLENISFAFKHNLIEAFNDIVGKEKYIDKSYVAVLRGCLNQKYSAWIKANAQKTKQRT